MVMIELPIISIANCSLKKGKKTKKYENYKEYLLHYYR